MTILNPECASKLYRLMIKSPYRDDDHNLAELGFLGVSHEHGGLIFIDTMACFLACSFPNQKQPQEATTCSVWKLMYGLV